MSNEVWGLILIRLKKKMYALLFKRDGTKCSFYVSKLLPFSIWAHVQRFLWKKMFQSQGDPLRTGSLELLHVPVEGKRSTGQILTLWREIPGFGSALSYRISSAFLHIISVIGFKKPSIICHQMLIKPFIIDYNHENFEKNLPFFRFFR